MVIKGGGSFFSGYSNIVMVCILFYFHGISIFSVNAQRDKIVVKESKKNVK